MHIGKFLVEIFSVCGTAFLIGKKAIQNYNQYGDATVGYIFIIIIVCYFVFKVRQKIRKNTE